jgi:hypothetical protein
VLIGALGAVFVGLVALPAAGAEHAPRAPVPPIPWSRLRNPILGYPDRATKDPAVVWAGGQWQALFSSVGGDGRWRLGSSTSPDLIHWSPLATVPHDPSVEGEASPDVVRAPDGTWVITYQSFVHDVGGGEAKLYYRTTSDFRMFSAPHPLGRELHPAGTDRMIDGAVAWTPAGLLLGYKVSVKDGAQAFEIARSRSGSLDGPWDLIGRPNISVFGDTIENYQFVMLKGSWRLLATSNQFDRPFRFTLAGDSHDPRGWLHWSAGRQLQIPQELWNPGRGITGATYEHANCAFFVNRAPIGGRYYLVYADSSEVTAFVGAGHAQLALARSSDLTRWSVPPH